MAEFTPDEIVRLGLERALVSDKVARDKKQKRRDRAILPTFMGKDGKIQRLGQGESRALILPNLYYQEGTEMRPIPVRSGGLPAMDNRSRIDNPLPVAIPPEPPIEVLFSEYLFRIDASIQVGDMGYGVESLSAFGTSSSPAFTEVTGGLSGEFDLYGQIDGLTGYFSGTTLDTATEIWSFSGGQASISFILTDPTILFITVRIEVGSQVFEEEIDLEGGDGAGVGFTPPPEPSALLFPSTINFSVTFLNPRRE